MDDEWVLPHLKNEAKHPMLSLTTEPLLRLFIFWDVLASSLLPPLSSSQLTVRNTFYIQPSTHIS